MASNFPTSGLGCLICLETSDVLKVVTTCGHTFCSKCLSRNIQKEDQGSDKFECPTCKVDCPLPENGADGLKDFDGTDMADVRTQETTDSSVDQGFGNDKLDQNEENVMCQTCWFSKGMQIKAKGICGECCTLYMCSDCINVHRATKATANHEIITLERTTEGMCKKHKKMFHRYCETCGEPCCSICVLFDHGDHAIRAIGDVFQALVKEVRGLSEVQTRRSENLKQNKGQLSAIVTSEVSRRRDELVKNAEDHAEKCITQIIAQKKALINQIDNKYELLSRVDVNLHTSQNIEKLDSTLAETKEILPVAEPNPNDFQKLLRLKQEMTTFGFVHEIEVKEHWETYNKLVEAPSIFVAAEPILTIGTLESTQRLEIKKNISNCKKIFEKKIEIDYAERFIPCVANLGNDFYAVAHPTFKNTLVNGIDIYKIPGEFQRTFDEHAYPFYDMAATPDGNLAVLAIVTTRNGYHVRLFHPVTGYLKSLEEFPINHPLSFDINQHHQYVILSNSWPGCNGKITVFNEDGSDELNHTKDGIKNAIGIACCRKYVYVLTKNSEILVFEFQERKLVLVRNEFAGAGMTCITANDFHEVTVSSETSMDRFNSCYSNEYRRTRIVLTPMGSAKISCTVPRVSVNTGNTFIVMSGDNWIRVYDESI